VPDAFFAGPLDGHMVAARHGAVGDVPGVFVEQVRPGAMAQISGAREGTVLAAVLGSLGIEGEASALRCSDGDRIQALWNGPGRYLVASWRHAGAALSHELNVVFAGTGAVAVDVSHARAVVRLRGSACRDVLAKGCPLDVDRMRPGDCAATVVSHFDMLVHCATSDGFELYVARSFSQAFFEWLLHAGMEYGVEVQAATT